MTLHQVAAALGIRDTSQLRKGIAAGVIAAQKVGRDWVVADEEVARLKSCHRRPGRPAGSKDTRPRKPRRPASEEQTP